MPHYVKAARETRLAAVKLRIAENKCGITEKENATRSLSIRKYMETSELLELPCAHSQKQETLALSIMLG